MNCMFKCYCCGSEFREPERYEWFTKYREDEPEIILQCPVCHDDKITWVDHENKEGEEQKNNE